MKVFCFTDIHNQQAMLDMPTTLRVTCPIAVNDAVAEFGKADVALVGGDNISDYPHWNQSCWLPKENFLDLKAKLTSCIASGTKDGKVLYVAGNNDMILGDIGTPDNLPYNTTEFYYTGPMIDTLGILPDSEKFEVMSFEKPWETPYLNGFHYVIGGYDFVGINIDPNSSFNTHDGYYTDETLVWLKNKLHEIDPHGKKPVFVVGHLSEQCYNSDGVWQDFCPFNHQKFHDAFRGHQNLFYLYGHIHGTEYSYRDFSSGAVLHFANGHTIDANKARLSSLEQPDYDYTFVHMGGLRPFGDYFEPDGLTGYGGLSEPQYFPCTGTPKLAQYLVMDILSDRVEFYVRNAGNIEGYSRADKPEKYVVYFR